MAVIYISHIFCMHIRKYSHVAYLYDVHILYLYTYDSMYMYKYIYADMNTNILYIIKEY
jgi:hypothetical protein